MNREIKFRAWHEGSNDFVYTPSDLEITKLTQQQIDVLGLED